MVGWRGLISIAEDQLLTFLESCKPIESRAELTALSCGSTASSGSHGLAKPVPKHLPSQASLAAIIFAI